MNSPLTMNIPWTSPWTSHEHPLTIPWPSMNPPFITVGHTPWARLPCLVQVRHLQDPLNFSDGHPGSLQHLTVKVMVTKLRLRGPRDPEMTWRSCAWSMDGYGSCDSSMVDEHTVLMALMALILVLHHVFPPFLLVDTATGWETQGQQRAPLVLRQSWERTQGIPSGKSRDTLPRSYNFSNELTITWPTKHKLTIKWPSTNHQLTIHCPWIQEPVRINHYKVNSGLRFLGHYPLLITTRGWPRSQQPLGASQDLQLRWPHRALAFDFARPVGPSHPTRSARWWLVVVMMVNLCYMMVN